MTILTDIQVLDIRMEVKRGVPHKTLARRYGIASPTVSMIATGARRPEAPGPLTRKADRTHCINGHPRTPENLRKTTTGYYECRECYRTIYNKRADSR